MSIALCFLTYKNIKHTKIWNNIFKKYKNILNVYIHNKYDFIDKKYNTHKFCIKNTMKTNYGDISLVKATIQLFRAAYYNKDNKFFILLSDSCIPIQNFDYIYNLINKHNTNLFYGHGHPMTEEHQSRWFKLL